MDHPSSLSLMYALQWEKSINYFGSNELVNSRLKQEAEPMKNYKQNIPKIGRTQRKIKLIAEKKMQNKTHWNQSVTLKI